MVLAVCVCTPVSLHAQCVVCALVFRILAFSLGADDDVAVACKARQITVHPPTYQRGTHSPHPPSCSVQLGNSYWMSAYCHDAGWFVWDGQTVIELGYVSM